jgi:mannose-6-phosphate isomerase-like protein (cupin superfamily)
MTSTTQNPTPIAPATSANIPPSDLQRSASIVGPTDGTRIHAFGNEIQFKLTGEQTGGAFTLGLTTVPVGNGPPPHVHERDDEVFIIVEGRYRIYLDGTWTDVAPGAVVYLPRGSEHTFQAIGDVPGKHWVLTTPSGFDQFFAKAAEVFAVPGPPDFAKVAQISADFGYRLTGVPGSPSEVPSIVKANVSEPASEK